MPPHSLWTLSSKELLLLFSDPRFVEWLHEQRIPSDCDRITEAMAVLIERWKEENPDWNRPKPPTNGRPRTVTREKVLAVKRMKETTKLSTREVCKRVGISRGSYYRYLKSQQETEN